MHAFLRSLDESVWMFFENGWTRSDKLKAEWDKNMHALFNANNKALNAIFYCTSFNELHRVSHV